MKSTNKEISCRLHVLFSFSIACPTILAGHSSNAEKCGELRDLRRRKGLTLRASRGDPAVFASEPTK